MISTHIRIEGFCVKTAIIHQLKRLCVPDCAYTESMYINFIHISLYDISLVQNILYQIKRDVAVWKRLRCPQRKQRTWWKIVATPYIISRNVIYMSHGVTHVTIFTFKSSQSGCYWWLGARGVPVFSWTCWKQTLHHLNEVGHVYLCLF